jgi:hypothetical protein
LITLLAWKTIAEVLERTAYSHPVGDLGQPVEARRGGAGENRLADPFDQTLGHVILAHGHEEHAHAGPSVRCLLRIQLTIHACLALALNHRGGESGELGRRVAGPGQAMRGDDDPRRPHGERLCEGVLDEGAPDSH